MFVRQKDSKLEAESRCGGYGFGTVAMSEMMCSMSSIGREVIVRTGFCDSSTGSKDASIKSKDSLGMTLLRFERRRGMLRYVL